MNFDYAGEWYEKFRDHYPIQVNDWIREHVQAKPQARLLDLAAGTGFLSKPLRNICGVLLAVDSEISMIVAGKRAADHHMHWVNARSPQLPFKENQFDIVTIGNALHWLSRDLSSSSLISLVQPRGFILIVTRSHFLSGMEAWKKAVKELLRELVPKEFAGFATSIEPVIGEHRRFFAEKKYLRLRDVSFTAKLSYTIAEYAGFLLSTSILYCIRNQPDSMELLRTRLLPVLEPYLVERSLQESVTYRCTAVQILSKNVI